MNNYRILASALHKIVMEEEDPLRIASISDAALSLFPNGDFAINKRKLSNLIFESGMKGDNKKYEEYCYDFKILLLNFLMYQKTNG